MSLANRCDCYVFENNAGRCNGTKERDICSCHGDKTLCDFYPEVKEKAIKEYESEDTNQILKDFGVLDKDGKLSEVYRNIYELRKKQLKGHGPLSTEWGPTICEIELKGEKVGSLHYRCSNCEFTILKNRVTRDYKFCPKCGREIILTNEMFG